MKKSFRYIVLSLVFLLGMSAPQAFAGNKDRSGQAGAAELLINPWAASSGWGNAGMSFVHGVEALYGNVAGITACNRLDLNFTHTSWLVGNDSDLGIAAFGLLARVGESSVLGVSMTNFSLGEIPITTTESPDGGLGTYKPNLMNINLAFAKAFSNSISGGFNLKIISESIKDMGAVGVALDAGIQYVTGPFENVHFGITLKNIGPTMKFSGDGLSFRAFLVQGSQQQFTVVQRADEFELPTQLSIAAAYDFILGETSKLTVAGNFCSNSFTNDQVTLGLQYGWKDILLIRAGYTYENGIWSKGGIEDSDDCMNINRGLSAGCSIQVPLSKDENGMKLAVDYSYRDTYTFKGTHSVGARIIF
ncbi:MAG: PorV/PorQ family protein [Bacteroidales bacterium]|nr:PorV/PorQ family protein [Bacteroidales bacterium]